ncbi:DUF1015 domain-containing protein [Mucilaginibacter agri]|uniref:Uncharacterized protein n=1 Tax=Mucilaginibacter agri TaxID=2695265 RepID=A0A966DQR6_9SPHI|nr:DUF1015 domain-containing protein [Mucilaginibacter agri]NCD68273.1 hypothetical protein [Mucilaginibacter agri]
MNCGPSGLAKESLHDDGDGIPEALDAFFIYEYESPGESLTGFWALTAAEDFHNGTIKSLRLENNSVVVNPINAALENRETAVIITYASDKYIDEMIGKVKRTVPMKQSNKGAAQHRLWLINDENEIKRLIVIFGKLGSVFHIPVSGVFSHVNFGTGKDLINSECFGPLVPAIYVSEKQLRSAPCHQLLKPGFPIDPESFFQLICKDFEIRISPGNAPIEPDVMHQFGVCIYGCWYQLTLKREVLSTAGYEERLDGHILHFRILSPTRLLSGSPQPICCCPGPNALAKVLDMLQKDRNLIAFTLHPASLNQLISAAYLDIPLNKGSFWIQPASYSPNNAVAMNGEVVK